MSVKSNFGIFLFLGNIYLLFLEAEEFNTKKIKYVFYTKKFCQVKDAYYWL